MFALFKNDKQVSISKRQISVTGILTEVLRPGSPVTSSHVRFETENSIYTICYNNPPGTELQVIA